jgi:transcriptional regulator with PAS, ATPase and Fis domain
VGSPEVRHVNVRLIAATNLDLRRVVLAGRFREDRLEDIPLLVQFFVKKYNHAYGKSISGLTRRAQTVLLQHPWPGNVRELENVISSAAITTSGDFIDLADLPENLQHRGERTSEGAEWRPLSLDEVRKVHIQRVLAMCMGNRFRAAQVLGIGRTSLYRYLKRDQAESGVPVKLRGAVAAGSVRG